MKRLNEWLEKDAIYRAAGGRIETWRGTAETPSIICVGCEQRVPLWDEMEQCFASPEV